MNHHRRWLGGLAGALVLAAGLIGLGSAAPASGPGFLERGGPDTTEVDTTERTLVEADSLEATLLDSTRVRRLYGNVRVRQDSTRLRSARALQYMDRRAYVFWGDVVIIERGDTLRADTVRYNAETKVGRARGQVRLTDGDVRVRAPSGTYFAEEKRSTFQEGVTLIDSASTLTSRRGEYFSDAKRAEFYEDVQFEDDDTYLEADSVTYFRDTGSTDARGRVFVERKSADEPVAASDTTGRMLLFGARARSERARNVSQVDGNALLVQIRTDSAGAPEDTLLVRAHRLTATRTDTLRRLIAIDSVRIWQQDIAAVADSAVYDRRPQGDSLQREETRLFRQPITWFEQAQVSGDSIRMKARNRSIDTVFVDGNAFAAQRDTTLDRLQQLKGRAMTAAFRQDSLHRIEAGPNAETIRFMKDGDDQLDGAVKASGDRIVLRFRKGDIDQVGIYSGVQSTVYDRALIPSPFELDGLRWVPEQQPTKQQLLDDERVQQALGRRALAVRPRPMERLAPIPDSTSQK